MDFEAISLNAFGAGADGAGAQAASLAEAGLPPIPFVGLRPFNDAESLLFFGRREQTAELLQLLDRTRFLAVVGSSGSGKSSLIRAGLVPKLKAGFIVGRSDRWRVVEMKPGNSPVANLAAQLLSAFGEEPDAARVVEFVSRIRLSGLRAVTEHISARLREEEANVFLLVDQFEEIFRFGSYDEEDSEAEPSEAPGDKDRRRDEAADFVSIMLDLARQEELPVYVVMTMRSDFLGDCDAFYGLPEAMNRSQYLVPRLTRQQRREAVENPIRLYGEEISPRLLDRVLNDMGDEPDQLPVMQHAMLRTWEKWAETRRGPVDLEHYEHPDVGTIKGALSKDADSALEGMSPQELLITERMFQALTKTDARGRRLRRPAHLSEIEAITGADRARIQRIVGRFSTERNRSFLVVSEDRLKDDLLLDISHESLIRQWAKLGEWVKDEVASREQYLRLAAAAVMHYDPSGPRVALWRDPELRFALDWWDARRPNEAWARRYHTEFDLAKRFLEESDARQKGDEARAQQAQRRKVRLLVAVSVVLAALLVLAVSGGAYALNAKRQAEASELRAIESAERAKKAEVRIAGLLHDANENAKQLEKERNTAKEEEEKADVARGEAEEAQKKAEGALKAAQAATLEANRQARIAKDEKTRAEEIAARAELARMADEQHRLGTKARNAAGRELSRERKAEKIKQATRAYEAAIAHYMKLAEPDAAASVYGEAGQALFAAASETGTPFRPSADPLLASVTPEWVGSQLLSDQPLDDRFNGLHYSVGQKRGLDYFGKAVNIYRGLALAREGARDAAAADGYNDMGATLEEVGGTLTRATEMEALIYSPQVLTARKQAAIYSLCEARSAYAKARNYADQIAVLNRIADIVTPPPPEQEEGGEAERPEGPAETPTPAPTPTPVIYAGCDGRPAEAVDIYEQAVPVYRALIGEQGADTDGAEKWRKDLVALLIKIGNLHFEAKRHARADESFRQAVVVSGGPDEWGARAETLMSIGRSLEDNEKNVVGSGAKFYDEAAGEYLKGGGKAKQAEAFRNIARRYYPTPGPVPRRREHFQRRHQYAIEYMERARSIYEELGRRKDVANSLGFIGSSYHALNKLDEALAALGKAVAILDEEVKDPSKDKMGARWLAQIHLSNGAVMAAKGQKEEARESYKKALDAATKARDTSSILEARRALLRLDELSPAPAPAPSPTPTPTPR